MCHFFTVVEGHFEACKQIGVLKIGKEKTYEGLRFQQETFPDYVAYIIFRSLFVNDKDTIRRFRSGPLIIFVDIKIFAIL